MNAQDEQNGARTQGGMLSIGALSRATGIPVDTLRSWERRYGFPLPVRKPSGHRLYPLDSIPRLKRIAQALAGGHRAGEVVAASDRELDALLASISTDRPGDEGSIAGREALDVGELIDAVIEFDGDRLTHALLLDWARMRPIDFLAERIAPLIRGVGEAWNEGRIEISHEHFLSERVSDLLRSIRLPFAERASGPMVVLATLPGEAHGLGLQMVALVLATAGFRTLFLGTDVPVDEIAHLAKSRGAHAIGISVSSASSKATMTRALNRLRRAMPKRMKLILGGEGAPAVEGAQVYTELRQLNRWAQDEID